MTRPGWRWLPRWWPWRRRHAVVDEQAAGARREAARQLAEARARWVEVRHARNLFAAQVEQAFGRRRPR